MAQNDPTMSVGKTRAAAIFISLITPGWYRSN
jgi:hypothetical protein